MAGKQSQRHYRTEEPAELRRQMLERDAEVNVELGRIELRVGRFPRKSVPSGRQDWLPYRLLVATDQTGETSLVLPPITAGLDGAEFLCVKPYAATALNMEAPTDTLIHPKGAGAARVVAVSAQQLTRLVCDGESGFWEV